MALKIPIRYNKIKILGTFGTKKKSYTKLLYVYP